MYTGLELTAHNAILTGLENHFADDIRHAGADEDSAPLLRQGKDLPDGAFGGQLHRNPRGCTCTRAVSRLQRSYFEKLKAPVKGFYTFERSAHSPTFEEPEKTLKIIQEDVLRGTNSLADSAS